MMDAHVHVWPRSRPDLAAAEVAGLPFPRDLDASAEALLTQMNLHGVGRAVLVQSPWWAHDDRYMVEVTQRHPGRFCAVGCLDLHLQRSDIALACSRLQDRHLRGMRVHLIDRSASQAATAGYLEALLRCASDVGLPLLFWARHPSAFALYASFARKFPDLLLVVDHMGYAVGDAVQLEQLLRLARFPGIHVKLSLHHQMSKQSWPWQDTFSHQQRIVEEFGAARCMWGSNWPMHTPALTYTERLTALRDRFPYASDADRAWVMGGTGARLWPV